MSPRLKPWLERAWMDRYLDRSLDEEDAAWFETYLLERPELQAELAADLDLRDGLARINTEAPLDGAPPAANDAERDPPPVRRRWTPVWAAAASLVLGFGIAQLIPTREAAGVMPNPSRLVVDVSRGGRPLAPAPASTGSPDLLIVDFMVPAATVSVQASSDTFGTIDLPVSTDGIASLVLQGRERSKTKHLRLTVKTAEASTTTEVDLPP